MFALSLARMVRARREVNPMNKTNSAMTMNRANSSMAQQIAQAAIAFEQLRTGNVPTSVTVVQCDGTLVITLHGALSPAEKALAKSPTGAAQVQEFHRQLFSENSESMRLEIKRITGREVREAAAEVETATGTVVHAFTTGAMVQVFLLTKRPGAEARGAVEQDRWSNDTGHEVVLPARSAAADTR